MLKIKIQNLGPIYSFEFDLEKDLHLLYGENSVGKSYAVACIYSILNSFVNNEKIQFYQDLPGVPQSVDLSHLRNNDTMQTINAQILQKLQQQRSLKQVDLREELMVLSKYVLENLLLVNIQGSLHRTFSSLSNLKNRYSAEDVTVTLMLNGYTICFGRTDSLNFEIIDINIEHGFIDFVSHEICDRGITPDGEDYEYSFDTYYIGNHDESAIDKNQISSTLAEDVITDIMNQIRTCINKVYFLPASRSGLYQALNSFSPIIAELSKHRFYIKQKIELPALSEPIADYFIRLSMLEKDQPTTKFVQLANKLEETILKGTVTYEDSTKKILFAPTQTDLLLDISAVSSMVAELSPIVAYLKYILPSTRKRSHLLFIEEPEAHLHPKIQVQLMEILAELTKYKVKVVLTSHSNYMFNKFENLLLENKIAPDKAALYHLVMTEKGSIVSDDMTIQADGIEDHNFAEVSERLYDERMNIFETVGSSADAI